MSWYRAGSVAALETAEGVLGARAGGRAIALFMVAGRVYATDDLCTHGHARLSEGYLEGALIECPLHQGMFDVRDGRAAGAPCSLPLRTYPVRCDDDDILVEIGE